MASTRTQRWRTGPSTTSLWHTSSLLSSTSRFASFASWRGQLRMNEFGFCVRCTLWNNSTLIGCSHTHTHTQAGNRSPGRRGDRRPNRGQLQQDSVRQLGLRLSGRQGDQAETEEHPLPAAGQKALPPSAASRSAWSLLLNYFLLVLLLGGPGGGDVKETGSCSDVETEDFFVHSPHFFAFSCSGAHCRCLGWRLPGNSVQPGKQCECGALQSQSDDFFFFLNLPLSAHRK